jgi:PAT family beta-lactamase induction signal transducer AmpG
MSFASGMPFGLVSMAIPDWMRKSGVDIRFVGLFALAEAPWTFKFLWSPLMDRFVPPRLGRRRGWAAIAQVGLLLGILASAGLGNRPETPWVVGALVLASLRQRRPATKRLAPLQQRSPDLPESANLI